MLEIDKTQEIVISPETEKMMELHELRDLEQRILNYMLLSSTNFMSIKSKISENDFVFLIHKVIYKYMLLLEELFVSHDFHGVDDLNTKIEILADILNKKETVNITSVLDILSQAPSMNITKDLEIINSNSMEREIAIYSKGKSREVTIETKHSYTWGEYIDDRLISVGTTSIALLPTELHDTFKDTIGSLSYLNLDNGDNEASMILYENQANDDGIKSLYLKKDVLELKWFDTLCNWADKYDLDEDTFPRDRFMLQGLQSLDISNKGINELPKEIGKLTGLKVLNLDENNIKEFPEELYQLRNLGLLSFINNEVSYISDEIINLQGLLMFTACHNKIASLPDNFFKLKSLISFCLHDNRLTTLPSEIGNLSNLSSITISNNDIRVLPESIIRLQYLESLDIENTHITDISINILKKITFNKLCINDDLLLFIIKNIAYLNVDTINLSASKYEASSQIIQDLNFKIDHESWVEDKDKKNNGCVQLSLYEGV